MLVLSRKLNQKIVIGGNITVEVLKVKGNTVRIGISAPDDVHILRGELPQKEKEFGVAEPMETAEAANDTDGYANVTVVFASDEQDGLQDESRSACDTLPFQQEPKQCATSARMIPEAPNTIQFANRVPKTLHRNRLAEIVNQVSNDKN